VAIADQLIADIVAHVRERQPHRSNYLWAIELELRTKWRGKRTYAPKVVRDALARACPTKADKRFPEPPAGKAAWRARRREIAGRLAVPEVRSS